MAGLIQIKGTAMTGEVSALHLVLSGDPGLFAIVQLSLLISLSAVFFAAVIGVPLGALIALTRFGGREGVIVLLNALMGLPPVVVGLAVFLALSRSGPLPSSRRWRGKRSRICGSNIATSSPP